MLALLELSPYFGWLNDRVLGADGCVFHLCRCRWPRVSWGVLPNQARRRNDLISSTTCSPSASTHSVPPCTPFHTIQRPPLSLPLFFLHSSSFYLASFVSHSNPFWISCASSCTLWISTFSLHLLACAVVCVVYCFMGGRVAWL